MKNLTMVELQEIWDKLADVPVIDDEIDVDFLHFVKGDDVEDVWHWMESQNVMFSTWHFMYQGHSHLDWSILEPAQDTLAGDAILSLMKASKLVEYESESYNNYQYAIKMIYDSLKKKELMVCVEGGVVTGIVSQTPDSFANTSIFVVDYDTEGASNIDEVRFLDGHTQKAHVCELGVAKSAIEVVS